MMANRQDEAIAQLVNGDLSREVKQIQQMILEISHNDYMSDRTQRILNAIEARLSYLAFRLEPEES